MFVLRESGVIMALALAASLAGQPEISPDIARQVYAECWKRGSLEYLLDGHEVDVCAALDAGVDTLLCSRGIGKTKIILVRYMRDAIRKGGQNFRFVTKEAKQATDIIEPLFKWLSAMAPASMRPEWHPGSGYFSLPNDSRLYIYASDNERYDSLRGSTISTQVVIDEAGYCDNLQVIHDGVIGPAVVKGGGSILIASTSPYTLDHYFWTLWDLAVREKRALHMTSDQNTVWTDHQKVEAERLAGGRDSVTFRREYLCERIQETRSAVIPKMTERWAQIVRPWTRPSHYRLLGALDPGTVDGTGYVLGYWDYAEAKMVIDGCWATLDQGTTADIYAGMVGVEAARHPGHPVAQRWSDTERQVIIDLVREHRLQVFPTRKDDLEMQVNAVNLLVDSGKLIITPEAEQVAIEMQVAIWNKQRTTWERAKAHGHFNLLAAAIYLIRNVDRAHNPYPEHYAHSEIILPRAQRNRHDALIKSFGGKRT